MKNRKKKKENVILYCRVNLIKENNRILIINQQEDSLRKLCKEKGYKITKIFTDYSTSRSTNSPELEKMKDFAIENAKKLDKVICVGFDRLARNFEEVLDILNDYEALGMKVTSLTHITNTKNIANGE